MLVYSLYQCERLLLEYMRSLVYYNLHTGTQTRTRVIVNEAIHQYTVHLTVQGVRC